MLKLKGEPYAAGPSRGLEVFLIEKWDVICEPCRMQYAPELWQALAAYDHELAEEWQHANNEATQREHETELPDLEGPA